MTHASVGTPFVRKGSTHVYHLYVITTNERDAMRNRLDEVGVASGIHYPLPLHLQPAFAYLGYKQGDLPCCEAMAAQSLSLPMFPELTRDQVRDITAIVRAVADRKSHREPQRKPVAMHADGGKV